MILMASSGKHSRVLLFSEDLFFIYLLPPIIFNAGYACCVCMVPLFLNLKLGNKEDGDKLSGFANRNIGGLVR